MEQTAMPNNIPEMPFPKQAPSSNFQPKSTVLAGFLSIMPGLGQAYLGYYKHAFIHIMVFAGAMTVMVQSNSEALLPLLPLFLFFYWAYNIIDAVRKTHIYNRILAGGSMEELPDQTVSPALTGSMPAGLILVVAGLVALSNTAFDMSLEWLEDWWPVIPIAFGGYLIYLDRKDKK